MAVRLRPVVLVAAVVVGLLAAFPHLAVTPAPSTRTDAVPPASGHILGACAPGVQRCDPSAPSSSPAGPAFAGAAFVATGVALVLSFRRQRRPKDRRPLARGVLLGIERPPQLRLGTL